MKENAPGQGQPEELSNRLLLHSSGPNGLARPISDELPGMPAPVLLPPERDGDYTLERTKRHRPEAYQLARKHLAAGIGAGAVAELCGMSKHTVLAIAEELGGEHGLTRDEVAQSVFLGAARRGSVLGAMRCAEMIENAEDVQLRDVALATKVLSEAAQSMSDVVPMGREAVGVKVEDVLAELRREG